MTKTLLAVLTIALGVAAAAGGASADRYSGLTSWQQMVFSGDNNGEGR